MPGPSHDAESHFSIPATLGIGAAGEMHARLAAALDAPGDEIVVLDLEEGTPGPLALQLVASAVRSFPSARIRLGEGAVAAMTAFDPPKET